MHTRHCRRGPALKARYLFLLLAIACSVALNFFYTLPVNRAAAQSEPTGDKIAFTRDNQIIVANPDGSGDVSLAVGADPSWSKQGKIAFTHGSSDFTRIAVMKEDGTNLVTLTPDNMSTSASQPDFSTDGTQVAFVNDILETDPGEPAPLPHARIHIINADGQNLRRFTIVSGVDHEYAPAFSPDGNKIAFIGLKTAGGSTGYDVYVANADGQSPPIKLTDNLNVTFPSQLAWSPDNLRLAFAAEHDIRVINADGSGGLINLTNTMQDDEFEPAWSPDGQKIAYSVNFYDTNTPDGIYVMDADGQNKTFINTTGLQPTWKKRDVTPEPTPTPTPYPEPTPTPTPFPEVDVAVELTASPNPVAVGQNLTYTLIVRNNGPFAAENVETFLIRSASAELVSVSTAQGTCGPDGNPLRCQLGQLAGGAQTSIQFVVRPTAAGEIVAFAGASTPTPDSNLNNNQQRLSLNVSDSCTPEVTSQVQRFIWSPGNQSQRNVTHVIYVRNNSGRQLNGQVHFVFDGLPASVESGDRRRPFSRTRCAQPLDRKYTSVSVGGRNQVWLPGQIIRLEVDFSNPNRVPVNYRLRIYTGPGLP